MNIELQCCGLVMLLVLLVIFTSEKSLNLYSRKLFFRAVISSVILLCMDILSIVGIYFAVYRGMAPVAARLICKLYLVSLAFQSYQGFLYAAGELFADASHRRLRLLYRVFFIIGVAAIMTLSIGYSMEGRVVYSYGPSTTATFASAGVYIISTIAMAFRYTDRSSARRRRCILLWEGCWLLAATIQFFRHDMLLVGFAVAFAMVLVYAELENPHEGVDRMTGQFTDNALTTYVRDLYRQKKRFAALYIRVEYRNRNVDPETEKTAMLRISNFLNQDREAYVFRQADEMFAVLYPDAEKMDAAYRRASAGLDAAVDLPLRLCYAKIPDSRLLDTAEEFLRFHSYLEREALGQSCITADEATVQRMRDYLHIRDMIDQALQEQRVEVFYQPIYQVSKKRFTAAEALVRIRNRDGSLVNPGTFIPVAEENGLIIPLGFEIFRQVCAFLATGQAQALGLEYVEVNLSVAQFDNENPARFVQETMEKYRVSSSWINLEITETASNTAKQALLKNMDALIKGGVRFSLDDFGTGRSNLDYFVEMPVDFIKFDYTFTQGYFRSEKARCVLESVTEMVEKMGLSIVAEGVETEEQLSAMCALGVGYIQGYYFSRPVPQEEFLDFLRQRNGVKA